MNATTTEPEWLTQAEAMGFLRYSDRKWFWKMVRKLRIPFWRVNAKRALFKREAIEAAVAQRTVNAKDIA
jgi:hypothetical protein